MKLLLDAGIFIHAEFAQAAVQSTKMRWGGTEQVLPIYGAVRKSSTTNPATQKEIDALFTIGRLIREGAIAAFEYWEVECETVRGALGLPLCNALTRCQIAKCSPPIRRSLFRQTVDFIDVLSKGGKKDIRRGVRLGNANQLAFLKWLCTLKKNDINALLSHASLIGLTEFESNSLKQLEHFQFLCTRSGSPENFVDIFHLWTAERNSLDGILTLDSDLPKLVSRIAAEKRRNTEIKTKVFQPLRLLQTLGVDNHDPVPILPDRFYYWHELDEIMSVGIHPTKTA